MEVQLARLVTLEQAKGEEAEAEACLARLKQQLEQSQAKVGASLPLFSCYSPAPLGLLYYSCTAPIPVLLTLLT